MPYYDEEYPEQSLWQSVLLFCCKGMIEGIMVVLFFWLLVQVLFTKQLEVHLQILLLVGLVAFCLCLVLGCILCWRMSKTCPVADKEPVTSAPTPADLVTLPQSQPLSSAPTVTRQEYEELEGDILDYPSTFSSPTPSDKEFAELSFASRTGAPSELKEHPKLYFPLRRLSTPSLPSAPVYKPITPGRASFRSLTRLGLLSKTRQMLDRRCSVTGDSISDNERTHLTGPFSPSVPEEPIPLSMLHHVSSCRTSPPCLHFTMAVSTEQGTLTVTILSLTGASHSLQEVSVFGSLAPLCPSPVQASTGCSLSPEPSRLLLVFRVSSIEELQHSVLRLAVYTRNPPSQKGKPMGELEVQCGEKDWKSNQPILFTKELSPNDWQLKKSQESLSGRGLCSPPQVAGQLFILLQYQTLVHRIKAMVLRADNLTNINQTLQAPDYRVVINLRHEGAVVSTRETKGSTNTLWKTAVLFDLPPGDVTGLPLMLEFIVLQNEVRSSGAVLGRVFIGADAPEVGRAHWEDMCSQGEVERARWHTLNPETLSLTASQSAS